MSTARVCAYCHAPADKSCSKCRAEFYCCSAHQALLWKYHRLSCFSDGDILTRSPNIQKVEAPYLKKVFDELVGPEVAYRMFNTGVEAALHDVAIVALINKQCNAGVVRTVASIASRNLHIDSHRQMIRQEMSKVQGRIDSVLYGTGLMPYYCLIGFFGALEGTTSQLYQPLYDEYKTYHILSDHIIESKKVLVDANNHLMDSLRRLEILTNEAINRGLDGADLYRHQLEVTRVHCKGMYKAALGIDIGAETERRYNQLLSRHQEGLIDPIALPPKERR